MPLSLHGIRVLDSHLGFALNSCDSFERPCTCRFGLRFCCRVAAKVLCESVPLELVNLRKRSNLITSDYD